MIRGRCGPETPTERNLRKQILVLNSVETGKHHLPCSINYSGCCARRRMELQHQLEELFSLSIIQIRFGCVCDQKKKSFVFLSLWSDASRLLFFCFDDQRNESRKHFRWNAFQYFSSPLLLLPEMVFFLLLLSASSSSKLFLLRFFIDRHANYANSSSMGCVCARHKYMRKCVGIACVKFLLFSVAFHVYFIYLLFTRPRCIVCSCAHCCWPHNGWWRWRSQEEERRTKRKENPICVFEPLENENYYIVLVYNIL